MGGEHNPGRLGARRRVHCTETHVSTRVSEMPRVPPVPRLPWGLTFSVLPGLLAWPVFSRLPPMVVRVGFAASGATVPLGYQLSVFPAFGAFCGALALDLTRG